MNTLSPYDILALFMIYSFLGWCMEVAFHAFVHGEIVNRGFLNGAVCPIYGFGMVAVLLLLEPVSSNIIILYIGGTLLCTVLELVGGFVLYRIFHMRWWDYSKEKFNLGGYICLKFSLIWGVACVFVVKVIHPVILSLLDLIPHIVGVWILAFCYALFAVDCVVTVLTVHGMNKNLKTLDRITAELKDTSNKLTQTIGHDAIEGEEKLEEMEKDKERKQNLQKETEENEASKRQTENRDKLLARKKDLESQAEELRNRMTKNKVIGSGRILKAFPNLRHDDYNDALNDLKEHQKKTDNKKR